MMADDDDSQVVFPIIDSLQIPNIFQAFSQVVLEFPYLQHLLSNVFFFFFFDWFYIVLQCRKYLLLLNHAKGLIAWNDDLFQTKIDGLKHVQTCSNHQAVSSSRQAKRHDRSGAQKPLSLLGLINIPPMKKDDKQWENLGMSEKIQ